MGGSVQLRPPRLRAWTLAASLAGSFGLAPLRAEPAPGVSGRVVAEANPVAEATVYAYQVVEKSLRKVLTDAAGEFAFAELPAGLYKIVALKTGFAPAVAVVTRRASDQSQYVQVDLSTRAEPPAASGFWQLRSESPGDVLRELGVATPAELLVLAEAPAGTPAPLLHTEVAASTVIAELPRDIRAQTVSSQIGMSGRLGSVRVALDGGYRSMASNVGSDPGGTSVEGVASQINLRLESEGAGSFDLSSTNQSLLTTTAGDESPVDFQNLTLRYRRDLGDHGTTALLAQFVDETGLSGDRQVRPQGLPTASRSLRLEGSYERHLGESTLLRSGLRYRESLRDYVRRPGEQSEGVALRSVEAWSLADWEVDPTWVVQYGVFTTAHDGTVSLAPRGGLVVRLRPEWQASVSASQRLALTDEDPLRGEFTPATLGPALGCSDAESSCYEVQLARSVAGTDNFRVGASWREFDRTVRLFLRDDFLRASEGMFLVPGDRLPEIHASFQHDLGPRAVARWTSTYGEGGGGAFRAANRRLYENEVSYLSSEIDATYRPTSTGIYVAFHRVEQTLRWIPTPGLGRTAFPPSATLERVELALSQDLAPIFDLPTDWAFRLGVELLNGGTLFQSPSSAAESLRHRVTTGVAVRF